MLPWIKVKNRFGILLKLTKETIAKKEYVFLIDNCLRVYTFVHLLGMLFQHNTNSGSPIEACCSDYHIFHYV